MDGEFDPAAFRRAETSAAVRVVIVTLDNHLARAAESVERRLKAEAPGLALTLHAAADWTDEAALQRCKDDIAQADVVLVSMLFLESQIEAIRPALEARRAECDAMVCIMSAGEIIRLTRMGGLSMDGSDKGPLALLKKLRGAKKPQSSGAGQMAMLRRLPKILRFIPGKAQDLRAYFLSMQYWLSGSEENLEAMVRFLVARYAAPERRVFALSDAPSPIVYPEVGVYHPEARPVIGEDASALPAPENAAGTVGLLVLRSYLLSDDRAHYDGVVAALEAQGLKVVAAFAGGLDARPAIERYFMNEGEATVDAVVSLTGFSLVGGPAYNDAKAAEETLSALDVPYIAAHPLEFQSLQSWGADNRGLSAVEATMMVAIPEIDGATGPTVFGGRAQAAEACSGCDRSCAFEDADPKQMISCVERAEQLAARTLKLIRLRRRARQDRKIAIVLFNFPPNGGAVGTAANLSVYESLHATLIAMAADGYDVEVPASVDALRERILGGNAGRYGTDANVAATIKADDHVREERWLHEIEAQWGAAPGRQLTNGREIFVLGAEFGNVFVGVQPAFGYEGDPMRLLFEDGFAPTHAFSAFYRHLRDGVGADAVLHFGTHGALEFMPGKQAGMSGGCWPDRLIGDLPNFYLYAANNPSEGAIAKRRSAATLVSYLTPPLTDAGLYKGVLELKETLDRLRATAPDAAEERARLVAAIGEQAIALDLATPEDAAAGEALIEPVTIRLREIEETLIPSGLHVVGRAMTAEERLDLLTAAAAMDDAVPEKAVRLLNVGKSPAETLKSARLKRTPERLAALEHLAALRDGVSENGEIAGLLRALDARFVPPAPGGNLLSTPDMLPTGRNIHGFDPFRLPSSFAVADGARQAALLLERHVSDGAPLPETVAMVLWGTDNLKSEGAPVAQALALMGARPRRDSYGRLAGAELIPLAELGRSRIDVVATLSGIFRDLLPMQTRLLAEAAWLAATADEPDEQNFVAKHARAQIADGVDPEAAALRVFSNADGAYGSNVNMLVDSGLWTNEDELADAYETRKCFAFDRTGRASKRAGRLQAALKTVDLAYQNLDSVELGVTTIDHYMDTLGGVSRAVRRARGEAAPVYIGDQTQGSEKVRTLEEQVALETRTRTLNPRWYESQLKHGYEGVRQIEAHVTNTMGWSATASAVAPWVYQQITETFVLDRELRERLAALNPKSSAKVANRLLEASDRQYWSPDPETLAALREAADDLEDRIEGVAPVAAS
ncbi:MAG: magnesium chelatase subunit H [Pseudomonadota bacterium]